jgi:hypothetical protein
LIVSDEYGTELINSSGCHVGSSPHTNEIFM